MFRKNIRWVRQLATVLSVCCALGVAAPVQAAQSASGKRVVVVAKKKVKAPVAKKKIKAPVAKAKVVRSQLKKSSQTRLVAGKSRVSRVSVKKVAAVAVVPRVYEPDLPLSAQDPLKLSSNSVLVLDQNTHEVLLSKNEKAVLPIASLTKLMTGLLVADANLPLDEEITITQDDVDTLKGSSSRLAVGTRLTRGEALHLALMSSENRAANALGRTFPGGLNRFVGLMNQKAAELGMRDTRYVEPTGLSSQNRSSAQDLARLVSVAHERPLLRELTTSQSYQVVSAHNRVLEYHNSNRLTAKDDWNIGLQKTGYIQEAGRCLVMQASVAGRSVIMVFLDAAGKTARLADAERVRRWVERSSAQLHSSGHKNRV